MNARRRPRRHKLAPGQELTPPARRVAAVGYRPADGWPRPAHGWRWRVRLPARNPLLCWYEARGGPRLPARQRVSHALMSRILRRRIMNKRLVWLAPVALAVLLSGCQVTVTTLGSLALDSLVGYKLERSPTTSVAGHWTRMTRQSSHSPLRNEITYYFLDANEVERFRPRIPCHNIRIGPTRAAGTGAPVELAFFITQSLQLNLIIDCEC